MRTLYTTVLLGATLGCAVMAGSPAAAQEVLEREGRTLLIGQTTLAGLVYYGWALPYTLGVDDPGGAGGLYMLTAAASFFLPFAATADRPVTFGMANLSRYGVSRGVLHGLLMGEVLATPAGEAGRCDMTIEGCAGDGPERDDRVRVGLGLAMSIAEGVAGYVWAGSEEMTPGTAHTIALGGDVGLVSGLLGAVVLDVDDGEGVRGGAAMALTGAALGIYGGHALASRRAHTWGDAQVMYTGALLGAWSGGAAAAVLDAGPQLGAASALLGGWIGLSATDRLVRETGFSPGDAGLLTLSTLAGALAGSAFGVMASNEDAALLGSVGGGVAGFSLAYRSFADRRGSPAAAGRGPLSVHLDPAGFATLLGGDRGSAPARLLSLSYSF